MCSSCKFNGQWDYLDHHFALKKPDSGQDNTLYEEKLSESLKQIREGSKSLVDINKFESVLSKFNLPVINT